MDRNDSNDEIIMQQFLEFKHTKAPSIASDPYIDAESEIHNLVDKLSSNSPSKFKFQHEDI